MSTYPQNETPNEYPIHELIKKRWSPYAFSDKKIEQEKINSLFEAIRWAPSSFNEQPWRIIYATKDDREEFDKVASLLSEGNAWAKNAYMLILVCSSPIFARNNKPNHHTAYDAGAAIENLFLQAVSMDLIMHEMSGFSVDKAPELLGIPEGINVLTMVAVGYPVDPENAPKELLEKQSRPRTRKSQNEIIYKGKWKI